MSLGSTQPFRPAGTVTISAGSSSTRASLVTNTASGTAFIRLGTDNSVVASAADMPVPAGARLLLHAGNFASTVAVVLNSGSGSVYVTRGDGTVY
jgi:hypothetical protein